MTENAVNLSSDEALIDVTKDLPPESEIAQLLAFAVEYWKPRNDWLDKLEALLMGKNEVKGPEATKIPIQVTHSGLLMASVAEKVARFMQRPHIAVIPEGISSAGRDESTRVERAFDGIQYWMESQSESSVWDHVVFDAVAFDTGVERIQFLPHSVWPLIMEVDPATSKEKLFSKNPKTSKKAYEKIRREYKQRAGVPFTTTYVPLRCFFPFYDGPRLQYSFELEQRPLSAVLANPLFASARPRLQMMLGDAKNRVEIAKKTVTIAHFSNSQIHAYYALMPVKQAELSPLSNLPGATTSDDIGQPIYLYHYEHGLGRSIYNVVGGRFGGWKTQHNRIEAVMNLMAFLTQDADEILSQVKTNLRSSNWTAFVTYLDPDMRDNTKSPEPVTKKEGEDIALWKGEEIKPLITPIESQSTKWFYDTVVQSMERLSGSSALYGMRQPGVDTGFQANLQVTMSEHLDERLEQHLALGGINRGMIIMSYIAATDEDVWVFYKMSDADGRQYGKYYHIAPKDVQPLPQLDATVRKPRPIDYSVAVRAAIDASQDRHGPGTPLLPDERIWEKILGEEDPDLIAKQIIIQNEKQKLIESGALSQKVIERLNLKLLDNSKPEVSADMAGQVDPALLASIRDINNSGAPAATGGVSGQVLESLHAGGMQAGVQQAGVGAPPPPSPANIMPMPPRPGPSRQGQGGGLPPGSPQPESAVAKSIAESMRPRRP